MKIKLIFFLMLFSVLASAEKVNINGIYYNLITKSKTAEVTFGNWEKNYPKDGDGRYSGDIVIPESVENDGIEYSVTTIDSYAFESCTTLSSVKIPKSVKSIGKLAFASCSSLTSVNIPDGVIEIEERVFVLCSSLTKIIIPNSVAIIDFMAFGKCSGLTSVTIPDNVVSIGKAAFQECKGLSHVIIGNNVTSIGDASFAGCSSLLAVNIPNSVVSIGNRAFNTCSSLSSISFPESLKTIGEYAFENCTGLTSLIIPNNVTAIGMYAFQSCTGLNTISISNNVQSLSEGVFSNCKTITSVTIPEGMESIGSFAFSNCTNLKSITISSSVNFIGGATFYNCNNLTSVNISDLSSWCNISYYADSYNPLYYAHHLFLNGEEIKDLTIPDDVTKICDFAFTYCNGLTSVKIPNSVSSIGNKAFQGCKSLSSVIIPSSITSIGKRAFAECKELADVYSYPENVPSTSSDAFENSLVEYCTLHVPEQSKSEYEVSLPWKQFKDIIALPKEYYTITYIVDGEEYKSVDIKKGSVVIPESAPTKEGYTFSGWSNIPQTMPAHDVTVTGTFTINKYKLTYMVDDEIYKTYDVEYGATITPEAEPTKEGYTFSGWSKIPETMPAHDVIVEGSFAQSNSSVEIDGIYYNLNQEEKSAEVVGGGSEYSGIYSGDIVIPSSINYEGISYSVTSIGVSAFQYCSVKSVTIPNSVTKICDQAFYNSESIETINMSENVQSIGHSAFCGLEQLKELKIPASVKTIGEYAFCRCKSITSFDIPEGVTTIGTYTFYRCEQLESVVIPTTIKTIDWSAFRECYQLFNLVFPEGLENIGGYAFYMCKQLAKISLPNSIKSIGGHAFANCDDLTEVKSNIENPFEIENVVFECYNKATLFIPKGTREKYENTNPWKRFSSIVEMKGPSYKLSYFVDGNEYKSYEIEYGEIITPEPEPTKEGYTFSGWSEIPETMPDHDVTITGTFAVNSYMATFKYGDVETTEIVEYGAEIPVPESLASERYTLVEWLDVPETMPAHDITIYAIFIDGVKAVQSNTQDTEYYQLNGMKRNTLQRGINILRMSDGTTRKVLKK